MNLVQISGEVHEAIVFVEEPRRRRPERLTPRIFLRKCVF